MLKAKDVAKWFVDNTDVSSGSQITPLKVQKLLYYAQAWHLALYDKPLMDARFEAWAHGPVCPEVYYGLNNFRYNPVNSEAPYFEDAKDIDDETNLDLLNQIMDIYGIYDAKYLENLTHQEEPWIKTRGRLSGEARCQEEIPQDLMMNFYKRMQDETED